MLSSFRYGLPKNIRDQINAASTGIPIARRANCEWLTKTFSARQSARNAFGQPICPADGSTFPALERTTIIDLIRPSFTDPTDNTVTCVLAGEGSGKCWVVAQSYLALAEKPITLFLMPSDVTEQANNEFLIWLIAALIRQTGEQSAPEKVKRWQRKLARWRALSKGEIRIIVVLDGINQQPTHHWAHRIDRFASELAELGGRLIITTRAHYFHSVKSRIESKVKEILVPEWIPPERNQLLKLTGIQFELLQESAALLLCNPRLLGIAITLYLKGELTDIAEFSVNRMMLEHIRMSERDSPEPEPALAFCNSLKESATTILARVKNGEQDDLRVLEGDLSSVVDGRK